MRCWRSRMLTIWVTGDDFLRLNKARNFYGDLSWGIPGFKKPDVDHVSRSSAIRIWDTGCQIGFIIPLESSFHTLQMISNISIISNDFNHFNHFKRFQSFQYWIKFIDYDKETHASVYHQEQRTTTRPPCHWIHWPPLDPPVVPLKHDFLGKKL